ncbi:MAG: 4-hydroxy-tetrahydrodipicolinate synthase [Moritella sp.]|uniref:4-hydroxy-tetrahydrodipicolinate synthase n=1 Tax=Moritella sp. TaxID=78556 RepID=UPI0025D3828C|nr:4-hydroxy-tetrahydrodipicolinate synthase [Moritella sp.]NQZ91211.1 4-hydroxy-tetrahydrodipicolinate synthase [Moritella sp.]
MLTGNIVALITPMLDNGDVDLCSLQGLVEYHIQSYTTALAVLGTTGESCTFSLDEHLSVVKAVLDMAQGRIAIIAGSGSNSTRNAIKLSQELHKLGVTAGLCVTPYYNKPTQEGLYQHYKAITEACDLPQILYNVPSRTGCDISNEIVVRLAELNAIIGIKDATGDLTRLTQLKPFLPDDFLLYSGDDATGCEFMLQGGNGVISVTSNVAADAMSRMCTFALAGQRQKATEINNKLMRLHQGLFVEANPIPVKWACKQLSLTATANLRLPLIELDQQYHAQVSAALALAVDA